MSKKIVIIGAGPTGLGAAWRLKELDHTNFTVFEKNAWAGGLGASFIDKEGFTWDIGGHVLFSHYEFVDRVWEKALNGQWSHFTRSAWVRMYDRWVPYPFQNNLRHLPPDVTLECVLGLVDTVRAETRSPEEAENFKEWAEAIFGAGICRHFMNPYNFKTWGVPLETMSKEWIAERVSVIDIEKVLQSILVGEDEKTWGPNSEFRFPLHRGTGAIYEGMAKFVEESLKFERRAVEINWQEKTVRFEDGSVEPYDDLITAAPLTELIPMLKPRVESLETAAADLIFTGGIMNGIGLRQPTPSDKCWIYFPEDKTPNYRVTYFSNYSPNNTPGPEYYSLLCESSASPHLPRDSETILEETIKGLIANGLLKESDRDDIVTTWQHEIKYSYPVPTKERNPALRTLIPWLSEHGIHSRGRFGLWCYEIGNMDHSIEQGKELVDMLLGEADDEPILPEFLKE